MRGPRHAFAAVLLACASTAPASAQSYSPGDSFRDCPTCPEMVVIPPGGFQMGSTDSDIRNLVSDEGGKHKHYIDETPRHEVRIGNKLAVARYEATRGEYAAFARATGRGTGGKCWTYEDNALEERASRSWRNPGFNQSDRDPVICVSWDDAKAYAAWLSRETGQSYRLLSEAEWEYAARAGTLTRRYWGDSTSALCRNANGADRAAKRQYSGWTVADCDDGVVNTAPVGRYAANDFGLYDMLGNVWEWTEDCYHDSYSAAPGDGSAWTSGECGMRVLRGGSWAFDPRNVRSANRNSYVTGVRNYTSGFRVAGDL